MRQETFKSLRQKSKKGKEHSMRYEDIDKDFAKWLRENYYNIDLTNQDVAELRTNYLNR